MPAGPGRRGGWRAQLTKCCLLERGIEVNGATAVVPWGANLDEVRAALRALCEAAGRRRGRWGPVKPQAHR